MEALRALERHRIVAVLRPSSAAEALAQAKAAIEGGLRLVEVTLTFDGALGVIEELAARDGVTVGAGTVLDPPAVRRAVAAGARFVVSPHTDPDIIAAAKHGGAATVSGALTPHEIVTAARMGADMVKVFPAEIAGGPDYIRALREPLPWVKVFATGGITGANAARYLECGTAALGVCSALFGGRAGRSRDEIVAAARKLAAILVPHGGQ